MSLYERGPHKKYKYQAHSFLGKVFRENNTEADLNQTCFCSSRRDIPCINYRMHTAHCMRNIALCTICDEPILRREIEEHIKTWYVVGRHKIGPTFKEIFYGIKIAKSYPLNQLS